MDIDKRELLYCSDLSINGAWRSLASAPALGAGGREFKSLRPDL